MKRTLDGLGLGIVAREIIDTGLPVSLFVENCAIHSAQLPELRRRIVSESEELAKHWKMRKATSPTPYAAHWEAYYKGLLLFRLDPSNDGRIFEFDSAPQVDVRTPAINEPWDDYERSIQKAARRAVRVATGG